MVLFARKSNGRDDGGRDGCRIRSHVMTVPFEDAPRLVEMNRRNEGLKGRLVVLCN